MQTPQQEGRAYILWGEHFDEVLATLFAASLRSAGWNTQVIGLRGDRHLGRRGVVIVADVSLGEALRAQQPVLCVVAPCTPDELGIDTDPRLGEFLARAQRQQAVFVACEAGPGPAAGPAAGRWWPPDALQLDGNAIQVLATVRRVLHQLEDAAAPAADAAGPPAGEAASTVAG